MTHPARLAAIALTLAATTLSAAASTPVRIDALGVENQYADIVAQIGGDLVDAKAILTDPNTDPHSFEASPRIAGQIARAGLIVRNGVGYDDWADKLIAASPRLGRKVIDVQHLLGLPDGTSNPHLWYDPATMPVVARAIASDLTALMPGQAATFAANLARFDASLKPFDAAIASFRAAHPHTPVAVTEPVADDLLQAMGMEILTPGTLQTAIMNGTDPSPQDVEIETGLLSSRRVRLFAYNQQVTDTLTKSFLDAAQKAGVQVVGVYETMPMPGYHYQSWMLAEVAALDRAVTAGTSTLSLQNRP